MHWSRGLALSLVVSSVVACGEKDEASLRSTKARAADQTELAKTIVVEDGEGLPVEPVVIVSEDGTTTVTNPDGTVVVTSPDGTVTVTNPDGTTTTTPPDGPKNAYATCNAPGVKAAGVKRLSMFEWPRTLAVVTGVPIGQLPDMAAISDPEEDGFRNVGEKLRVTRLHAEGYFAQAEALAEKLMKPNVPSFVPESCKLASGARPCAVDLVSDFGPRAYRRPLSSVEANALTALYDDLVGDVGHVDAMRGVIEAVLQVPQTLYRTELGLDADVETAHEVALSPYEVASQLSYALTAAPPDAALLAAAADGSIVLTDTRRMHAERLMTTAQFGEVGAEFLTSWLGLHDLSSAAKDAMAYPQFNENVRAAMAQEAEHFAMDIFGNASSLRPGKLLTADFTYVNGTLASFYGMGAVSGWQKVPQMNGRAGIIGQGAFLAARAAPGESSPIKRGATIARRLLCVALPDPPSNIPPLTPVENSGEMTTRERIAEHSKNEACSGCHGLMDPLGFALENYDGVGAYRQMQNGKLIDATGELGRLDGLKATFQDWGQLAGALASSMDFERCFTRELYRFTAGVPNVREDLCRAEKIRTAAGNEPSIGALLLAMATDDAFVRRRFEP